MTATTVAVLAGGRSVRMGSDKAQVPVAGRPMLGHVVAAAAAAGLAAVVVGPGGDVADVRPAHSGPLAGVEAALLAVAGDVIAVAVDQPWVRAETLAALSATGGDAAVPVSGGALQVTCARYGAACLDAFSAALDSGRRSLQNALRAVDVTLIAESVWRGWGEDGRSWFSADTAEAVAAGIRAYGPPGTLPP